MRLKAGPAGAWATGAAAKANRAAEAVATATARGVIFRERNMMEGIAFLPDGGVRHFIQREWDWNAYTSAPPSDLAAHFLWKTDVSLNAFATVKISQGHPAFTGGKQSVFRYET